MIKPTFCYPFVRKESHVWFWSFWKDIHKNAYPNSSCFIHFLQIKTHKKLKHEWFLFGQDGGCGGGGGVTGRLSWLSVGLEIQRPEVRTRLRQEGAQDKNLRVSPSHKKCCADSMSVCPTPRVYTHAQEWSRTHVKVPCSPCQRSVDYGITKRPNMRFIINWGLVARLLLQLAFCGEIDPNFPCDEKFPLRQQLKCTKAV